MPRQFWFCDLCQTAGVVLYPPRSGMSDVVYQIYDDHVAASPCCPYNIENPRPHMLDRVPVRIVNLPDGTDMEILAAIPAGYRLTRDARRQLKLEWWNSRAEEIGQIEDSLAYFVAHNPHKGWFYRRITRRLKSLLADAKKKPVGLSEYKSLELLSLRYGVIEYRLPMSRGDYRKYRRDVLASSESRERLIPPTCKVVQHG